MKGELEAWRRCSLAELELAYLYLGAIVLRVRSGRQVTGLPVLVALGVLADGSKRLLALELCSRESGEAWRGVLEDLAARGLVRPKLCIVDGNPGKHASSNTTRRYDRRGEVARHAAAVAAAVPFARGYSHD